MERDAGERRRHAGEQWTGERTQLAAVGEANKRERDIVRNFCDCRRAEGHRLSPDEIEKVETKLRLRLRGGGVFEKEEKNPERKRRLETRDRFFSSF